MTTYGYKVKRNYLKVDPNNAYKKAKIEQYNFEPIMERSEEGDEAYYWAEGWAKSITIKNDTTVGKWVLNSIEQIYAKEKDKEDSSWLKEIAEIGYEFDSEGHIVENEATQEKISAQLCVMYSGADRGLLFINLNGAVVFYEQEVLLECVGKEIERLLQDNVIYKKILNKKK